MGWLITQYLESATFVMILWLMNTNYWTINFLLIVANQSAVSKSHCLALNERLLVSVIHLSHDFIICKSHPLLRFSILGFH